MKLISVNTPNETVKKVPAFGAAPKKAAAQKLMNEFSEQVVGNLFNSVDSLDIKRVIDDPNKKKVFFGVLSALLTTTALKITELFTEGEDAPSQKISDDGDIIEIKATKAKRTRKKSEEKPIKFEKHLGPASKSEKALETSIKDISARLDLNVDKQNELITFYNRFCGLNHKGSSYNVGNEEIKNSAIASELAGKLNSVEDENNLNVIVSEYNGYSKEKQIVEEVITPVVETTDEAEAEAPAETHAEQAVEQVESSQEEVSKEEISQEEIAIPKIIENKNNIKKSYKNLPPEARAVVAGFFESLAESNNPPIAQGALKAINKNYLDLLPQIACVYNSFGDNNDEQKSLYLSYLANGIIKKDSLINWEHDKKSHSFGFLEYNSLISRGVSSEAIKNLSQMKNTHKIEDITIDCASDNFTLNVRKAFIGEYFRTIYDVFNLLNKDSNSLMGTEEKEFEISDVAKEVSAHKDYKNLRKFLTKDPSKPLNAGRMSGLLKIYNESKVNKDFFTLHSYLRFMERYVLPNFDLDNAFVSVNDVRFEHIKQVKILKGVLQKHLNKPVEVMEYNIPSLDIKAPKIIVPHWGNSNDHYEITINAQGKIHTIF